MNSEGSQDRPSVAAGERVLRDLIDGVRLHEMHNIITRNGITTEIVRPEWDIGRLPIAHLIHVQLRGHAVSAWHCHHLQTDRIFVTDGALRIVLFDDREDSPTRGKLDVLHLGRARPATLLVPPFVWHGFQNLEGTTGGFVNFFDRAYCYENPDEWRLPEDTDVIPYRFLRH